MDEGLILEEPLATVVCLFKGDDLGYGVDGVFGHCLSVMVSCRAWDRALGNLTQYGAMTVNGILSLR